MELGRNSYWKFGVQGSRSRIYGDGVYLYESPEIKEEDRKDIVGMTSQIDRLPDDVITRHVFDKISDPKSLFNCSLVSKRFASLVPDTQIVSLNIPSWRPVCSCHQDPTTTTTTQRPPFFSPLGEHYFNFLSKPFKFIWWLLMYPFRQEEETHYPDVIRTKPPAVKKFLKKFSCIKSLSIDLSFLGVIGSPSYEPLVRWKFDKFGFIYVSAKSREDGGGDDDDVTVNNVNSLTMTEAFDELDLVQYHFMDAVWRYAFVESILGDFKNLKNVLVTDCMGQGRVELDEEEIDGVRNIGNALEDKVDCRVRVWRLPVVKLPLSGCVMKEATLCVFKEVGIDDGLMAENAFEEKEYCELAKTIMKNGACYEFKVLASEVNGRIRFGIKY